ncbi:MAG TPA: hypothetical protein VMD53_11210 [Rhizomicrobium sp.]|nr:hypothetical protein [Rhizomicrobium sp.]
MGVLDTLRGRVACPVCNGPIDTALKSSALLCKGCDTYLEIVDGALQRMPEDRIGGTHAFGAPTPWSDLRAVTYPSISVPMVQLTDLALTKNKGARVLEAQWPDGCCVCGKPATRRERVARVVIIPREWGILNVGSQKLTLVADVPHCSEHSGGAAFERISFAVGLDDPQFGLCFRSLAYRNAFRKLNPWPWRRF